MFNTVNTVVQLKNSLGEPIDQGTVQYYSGGWRQFGTTSGGNVSKELLPNNYTFRMTYGYASNDKQQNTGSDPIIVFNTINTTVELKNSLGESIDQGAVQYYSGGWRQFGTTSGGSVSKELLPNNYTFRMMYEYISKDAVWNTNNGNTVRFTTVLCTVQAKDTLNQPVDGVVIGYYSGGWRQFGTTVNGEATKELLPAALTFRASYNGTQESKSQDLSSDSLIEFIIGQ